MNTEHTERHHSSIHAATAVDRSNPQAPKRGIAKDIVSNGRRLRTRIGVIAARPELRILPSEGMFASPKRWRACAGKQVTVTVSDQGPDRLRVRATFVPPSPESDQAFETLLRRSIAQEEAR